MVLALALSVWWPLGILRRLDASERLQMALSALLGLAVVSVIKNLSNTSCPWDLAEFGGVARYASHWALGVIDGGGGRCFPAAMPRQVLRLWGYFALRRKQPVAARWWLAGAVLMGLVLGGSAAGARCAFHEPHPCGPAGCAGPPAGWWTWPPWPCAPALRPFALYPAPVAD